MTAVVEDLEHYWRHWCEGCGTTHLIPKDKGWTFNGDLSAPMFHPSVKHTFGGDREGEVCHYFIRVGRIDYCHDCTHGLSGRNVPLKEVPYDG